MDKIDIIILSKAKTEEDCDETEFFTTGTFEETDKGFVIIYGENAEIGYESCTVTITAEGEAITIERSAPAPSLLTVEKGKKHYCVYGTPFGDFMMGINAFEVKNELNPEGGNLYLRYSIDINSDFVSENELKIAIKRT